MSRLPLLPRVDYVHRICFFDALPNRAIRKHWRESTTYLPVRRRMRRVAKSDRQDFFRLFVDGER